VFFETAGLISMEVPAIGKWSPEPNWMVVRRAYIEAGQDYTAMAKDRQKPPFWRRGKPNAKYDIALLRPADRARGKRFETLADAQEESERSEQLLRSFTGGNKELADFLAECRAGDYECNRPFCPICARVFRRWFIGEVLRITKGDEPVRIYGRSRQSAGDRRH
jgi:hypothetical protein